MSDGYGLDKAARLKAKHEAEAEKPPPLEPGFPYVCEAFDPGFFRVAAEQTSS